jgi:hypothetical protein
VFKEAAMKKLYFLIPGVLLFALSAEAQIRVGLSAGAGLSYVTKEHSAGKYRPSILPQADLNLDIPLTGDFSLLSGLGYKRKGYGTKSVLRDDQADAADYYNTTLRYDYLQIPVLVAYKHPFKNHSKLQFGAGLYYGFLVNAKKNAMIDHYDNGELSGSTKYSVALRTGLTPSGAGTPDNKKADVLILDCGLKIQVNYIFREHFVAGFFHEQSLYDINIRNNNSLTSLKLRSTGLSLGYIF